MTSAVRTPNGGGYWILTANGTVYDYGNAGTYGSPGGEFGGLLPAMAVFATSDGRAIGWPPQTAPSTTSEMLRMTDRCSAPHLNGFIVRGNGLLGSRPPPGGTLGTRRTLLGGLRSRRQVRIQRLSARELARLLRRRDA